MENCTIYSHQLDFDKVVKIVKARLPKAQIEFNDGGKQKSLVATIKGGFFGKAKKLVINYRERENPSYKLDAIECGLTQNLAGMVNFIQGFPAQNVTVRDKFLHKVMAANCEMPFMAEPQINNEFKEVLKQILTDLDAFVFTPPNSVFKKAQSQHFVDKNFNLIIAANGHCEIDDISVNVDAKYHDEPKANYTDEQINRKAASEKILSDKGIKVNANLPCTAAAARVQLRTQKEVIDRAYALLVIAAKGEGVESENLTKLIEKKKIDGLTPKENQILSTSELDDQAKAYATWRYESLDTLLWALSLVPELKFPNEICDVPSVVSTIFKPSREDFEQSCSLRSPQEILDQLDVIYRMHWACVDARIKNQTVGGQINPSVIYERHYALNWLTKYQNQEWDQVQTNT